MSVAGEKAAVPEWEDVESPRVGDYLERIAVPGGWLYRNWFTDDDNTTVAMVFVPWPKD